jgi:hypothetical protein
MLSAAWKFYFGSNPRLVTRIDFDLFPRQMFVYDIIYDGGKILELLVTRFHIVLR